MNKDIPYSYALDNHIFYDATKYCILCNEQTTLASILEVNRFSSTVTAIEYLNNLDFEQEVKSYYSERRGKSAEALEGMDELMNMDQIAQTLEEEGDLLDGDDDAPVIRLLNSIFFEALQIGASDIHIEPYESSARIRFRVNGTLKTILTPPKNLIPLLVSRIKVLAKLDIAEKRVPQDGRMSILLGGRQVDLRVSSLPSNYGERAVLRLLDKQNQNITVENLGMDKQNIESLEALIQRPHGIMLVTGPTGSGKTTTLYAALKRMNRNELNIMTVEDPVEYDLPGISQTQVNNKTGMTFAKSLKAILRQDPDVVLIGEIRDLETAEIAIQASLTGHLVLATLHTNTAVGAITRLQDLGVDRFLLASSVRGIMAQRLVRNRCQNCLEKTDEINEGNKYNHGYSNNGCDECQHSGFTGRKGIFELVTVTPEVQDMIHDGNSESEIEKYFRKSIPSIFQMGESMVSKGVTTIEEVLRVTSD